ncbi:hypothetical protein [Halalkalibacter akibai]|uniref:Uncharacterized protein n=1 Tax=Halalkalibacter akibai (strain ATCC 43226 / DSM 21942 / CIP 109018 / JCM 9157 / 1139) TaxID=1236973 RepID=W4QTC9_HALA3|nr:hypothetical protein [Halalkalibacter akibai]GAE35395.1 hypothetical protein JCM9157_2498 [Halalkalibacter akibai JCM 9157]
MIKKSIIASVAAITATTVMLGKRNLRSKVSRSMRQMYTKITRNDSKKKVEQDKKIGLSHPYDFEDNKMIGEGALTSVQYYNQKQQKSHQ